MKKVLFSIAAITLFSVASKAQTAQTASATQTVAMNVSDAIDIAFVQGTPNSIMAFTTTDDFASGVKSEEVKLRVRSNKNFHVDVKTNNAFMQLNGSASTMPVNKMAVAVTQNNTGGTAIAGYMPLSNASQQLITGANNGGNQVFGVKYQSTPGFDYPAGAYTTEVVYTATQQ